MSQPTPPPPDIGTQLDSSPTPAPGWRGRTSHRLRVNRRLRSKASHLAPPQSPGEIGRLGGYRILRILGEGGMGMVYEGEDLVLKRRVAVKVMRPEIAAEADAKGRFLREAQATAALHDDYIVTIHQVGEERGVPFLVMPLLAGESLHSRLKKGRLTIAEAVRVGRQTA